MTRRNLLPPPASPLSLPLALALSACLLSHHRAGAVCVDPPLNLLCLNATVDTAKGSITFTAVCHPPPGQKQVFWCAFGLSNTSTSTMFPADVTAIQYTPPPPPPGDEAGAGEGAGGGGSGSGTAFLEDRNSAVGFQSPPCYPTQVSQLVSFAGLADGGLTATWWRPLALPAALLAEGYLDVTVGGGGMTVLAASSSDAGPESGQCAPAMQVHSYCVPGVTMVF
jgi:hypothetical protein